MKKIETNILKQTYLKESDTIDIFYDPSYEWNIIRCYPEEKLQTWIGMGGAITEASCYNFLRLPLKQQQDFLESYYGTSGLNYNLGRISIGSNDFCLNSYEYTKEKDFCDFNIQEDKKYILPVLKEILQKKSLTLLASPWSPPSCLKENGNLYQGDKLKKECYEAFASYLKLFLNAYQKEGIEITYLTVQNEPNASQRWESCKYTLEELKELQNIVSKKNPNIQMLGWDHNKENLVEVADKLFESNIKGLAFHSYMGIHAENLGLVHKKHPNALLIHTEGCCGYSKYNEKEWIRDAEYYLINLISDINHGLNGYIDWNILLDSNGGPNHKENYCKSPIMLNKSGNDFIKTPIYYYLCHIGKFIQPGDSIVPVSNYRSDIFSVAAVNKERVAITLMNAFSEPKEVDIVVNGFRTHDVIAPHSIVTYLTSKSVK